MPQSPPSDMLFPIGPHSLILSNNSTLWWPNIQISEPIGDILIQTTKPIESSDQLLPTYLKQRVFCQFSSEYRQKDFWRIFKFCSWIVHIQRNLWEKKHVATLKQSLCLFPVIPWHRHPIRMCLEELSNTWKILLDDESSSSRWLVFLSLGASELSDCKFLQQPLSAALERQVTISP